LKYITRLSKENLPWSRYFGKEVNDESPSKRKGRGSNPGKRGMGDGIYS